MNILNKKTKLSSNDKLNLKKKFKDYVLNKLSNTKIIISKGKEAKIYDLAEKNQNSENIAELCPDYYDYMTNKEFKKQLTDNFDVYLRDINIERQLELTKNKIELKPFIIIGTKNGFYQIDLEPIIINL